MRARLLVAEDNKVNRLLLARNLELLGHTVATAENGRVALEQLRASRFDLVLLDMEMPEVDGFGVLGRDEARPAAPRRPGDRHVVAGRDRPRRPLHRARRRGLSSQAGEPGAPQGAHRGEPRKEAAARPAERAAAPIRHAGSRGGPRAVGVRHRRTPRARDGDVRRTSATSRRWPSRSRPRRRSSSSTTTMR